MENEHIENNSKKVILTSIALGLVALAIATLLALSLMRKKAPDHIMQGLPAPQNMRVENNVLLWDNVKGSDGYRVYYGDNQEFFSSTTINRLIVNELDENATYRFTAAAIDDEGITSEHRSNSVDMNFHANDGSNIAVGLAIPQPYINDAVTHMEWPAIPNAVGYSVSVNSVEQAQTAANSFRINELYTGIHQLRVRALGNGFNFAHSAWSAPIHVYNTGAELTAPFTQINVSTASWTPVSGATAYEVSIDGSTTQKTDLTYPLDTLASGTHDIKVRAINGASEGAWSNTVTHTVAGTGGGDTNTGSLLTPSLRWIKPEKSGAEWDPVNGATSYDVYLNGNEISNGTSTDFWDYQWGDKPGVNNLNVRSRNGSNVSDWSNGLRPTVNFQRPIITLNGDTMSWDPINSAHDYETSVDGNISGLLKTTTYNVGALPDGVHQCSCRSGGTIPPSMASHWSRQIGWTIGAGTDTPAAPFIGLVEELHRDRSLETRRTRSLWWSAVLGATGYDVMLDGSIVSENQIYLNFMSDTLPAGLHTVKVRSRKGSYTSDWSNEVSFDPSKEMDSVSNGGATIGDNLPKPTLGFAGATCTWGAIAGAKAYEVNFNGTTYITDKLSHSLPNNAKGSMVLRVRALNNFDRLSQWSNVIALEIS